MHAPPAGWLFTWNRRWVGIWHDIDGWGSVVYLAVHLPQTHYQANLSSSDDSLQMG